MPHDVWQQALDDIHADPNFGTPALYRAGGVGDGVQVTVLLRAPDADLPFGATTLRVATRVVEVRMAEVAAPAEGDVLVIGDETLVVQAPPKADAERLSWILDLAEG